MMQAFNAVVAEIFEAAVLDFDLARSGQLALLKQLRAANPATAIVVL